MRANMTQRDERQFTRVRLVSVSSDQAKQVIGEHETVTLSSQDWKAFLAALVEADKPRPRLEAAAHNYRERRMSREAD